MMELQTPAQLGYRMPAEWEPHEAIWLSWPHKIESWPNAFNEVPGIFAEIAFHIAESELIRINVVNLGMADAVRQQLAKRGVNLSAVRFHMNPTNDAWVRDHGPLYVVRDCHGQTQRAITDWGYNSWGDKYPPYDLDNTVPSRVAAEFRERRFLGGMILEGGSIDVNGTGTLMTTESCLLNPNRNPDLSKAEIEQRMRDYLGASHFLWLGDGILGDDTDGHIDDLARFVNRNTVVTVVENNATDPNYAPLQENLGRLKGMANECGERLNVIELPMPEPVTFEGHRLPASYANFLITNGKVLVPTYRCTNDAVAIERLTALFPGREVVGINCTRLVWGLGAIHCVTQQQPLGLSARAI